MAEAQDDVMNEVMQMLEATPDTGPPTGLTSLVTPGNDIPAKRRGQAGLSDKDVEKYDKRQEAYIGSKAIRVPDRLLPHARQHRPEHGGQD